MTEVQKKQEPAQRENRAPRLFVFPRLDLVQVDAAPVDELAYDLEHMAPEVFDTERAARRFYKQHLTTHHAPVYLASLHNRRGAAFTGQRFSEYDTAPADTWVDAAIDFVLDNPIGCTLAEDWQFGWVEIVVSEKMSHKTVRRHTAQPARELVEALSDVEAALYDLHGGLSREALTELWSSFEIHKHLTLHALKMGRYQADYSASITKALDLVRRHIADYVADILGTKEASSKAAHPQTGLARKMGFLKTELNATVEELEALSNLDRKTLRRIELGEPVRQSTIDKSPASRGTLDDLMGRLIENRARKHRLN